MYAINKNKKEEQTGIEPVTLGPAIPRSTTELLPIYVRYQQLHDRQQENSMCCDC